jgi:hypothetical protein
MVLARFRRNQQTIPVTTEHTDIFRLTDHPGIILFVDTCAFVGGDPAKLQAVFKRATQGCFLKMR